MDEDERLFDDMADADAFEVDRESSDRELIYAIWTRGEIGDLPSDEAWAILFERYPNEHRFLLLNAYEELTQRVPDVWTPSYFVKKLLRARKGSSALAPQVRDLVTVAWNDIARADLRELGVPAKRTAPSDDEINEAYARLSRFASSVLRELHDKTVGGSAIGPSAPKSVGSFEELLANAKGPKATYAATKRYDHGQLVEHPKFGVGVVTSVVAGRAEILFKDGPRKLVCG